MLRHLSLPLMLLLAALPAAAQSSASSAETRAAQFVLVLDDSASMRDTDPNRLAVFAVQSLLAMLDDRDEVSIVLLNGAAQGEEPPPIQPLGRGRRQLEGLLKSGFAAYAGENTPCRSALTATRRLLEHAHRPNVAQVVLFLTDGRCTPDDREVPDPEGFLQGLASQAEGLLQFYLLYFPGETISPQLPHLAEVTGGAVTPLKAGDPTALLSAFATALSRSQGYEAQLVEPGRPEINAHRGAKRVRLLAVAPGEGAKLGLSIHDRQGSPSRTLGTPRADVFQYRGGAPTVAGKVDHPGQPFRFVAVDYKPDVSPMTVQVTGVAETWKAVAMPEYRLSLRMMALQGACDSPGQPVAERGVETGSTICLVADLVNEAGITVDAGLTGREIEASVRLGQGQPIPMQLEGDKARFRLQRNNLEKGDLVLQPVVRLNLLDGQQAELRGRSMAVQVSSVDILPVLDKASFGTLLPGQEATRNLKIGGNFPAAPMKLSFRERKDVPSCVTVELDGQPEGKPAPVSANTAHRVTLRVAPYCGPRSFEQAFPTRLVLNFQGLAPRDVPIDFTVRHEISVPPELELKVKGGKSAEAALPLGGNRTKDLRLTTALQPAAPGAWPESNLGLSLAGSSLGEPFTLRREGEPLRLRAAAHPCCTAGSFHSALELRPASLEGYAPGAEPPEPMVVPVRVEVESAGLWACYGWWILRGLALLLLLLLVLYVINMFRNSRFLKPVRVAEKLVPLAWTAHGGTSPLKDHKARVLDLVRGALPWPRRMMAWLRANPLAFGLPGRSYRETMELILQPHRDVSRSAAVLVPRRGLQEAVSRDPAAYTGRLFAVAEGSASFLCVPDKDGRIGRMSLDGAAPAFDPDPSRRSPVRLRGHKLLRHPEDWESHEEGRAAGWQVG